ncbi:hypothetical protein BDU57DRAFT_514090 [Ampelomyces quisqualis]|uniref:Uncharacterized protein n=1 Tax=Ampelomyces quisqualis TaxID=50730 RepID=A0A6A5QSA4_AMPQU|nr:hypothetical protein BDU57DRAFT_514090 [Ampelomyces quisqualis]
MKIPYTSTLATILFLGIQVQARGGGSHGTSGGHMDGPPPAYSRHDTSPPPYSPHDTNKIQSGGLKDKMGGLKDKMSGLNEKLGGKPASMLGSMLGGKAGGKPHGMPGGIPAGISGAAGAGSAASKPDKSFSKGKVLGAAGLVGGAGLLAGAEVVDGLDIGDHVGDLVNGVQNLPVSASLSVGGSINTGGTGSPSLLSSGQGNGVQGVTDPSQWTAPLPPSFGGGTGGNTASLSSSLSTGSSSFADREQVSGGVGGIVPSRWTVAPPPPVASGAAATALGAALLDSMSPDLDPSILDTLLLVDHVADLQMCKMTMQTEDGGNCELMVECPDGSSQRWGGPEGARYEFCKQDVPQSFDNPSIGFFNLTYKDRDGPGQGQGLTTPVLQLAAFGYDLEIHVDTIAREFSKHRDCKKGKDCGEGPFMCMRAILGIAFDKSRLKRWHCAIPWFQRPIQLS